MQFVQALFIVLLLAAIFWLLPYRLARHPKHPWFRNIQPGRFYANAVGGVPEKFYGNLPEGHHITVSGEVSENPTEDVLRPVKPWGLWYTGFPPYSTPYRFEFKHKQAVRKVEGEKSSYVLEERTYPDYLPWIISLAVVVDDAELGDNNQVKVISNVIFQICHAGRFTQSLLETFEENIIALIQGKIKDFVKTFDDYTQITLTAMNEINGPFQTATMALNTNIPGMPTQGLVDYAGIKIVSATVTVIEGDEEMQQAAREAALKEAQGRGVIAEAAAKAQAITLVETAEANALRLKVEALASEGPTMAYFTALRDLQNLQTLVGGEAIPAITINK